MIDREVHGRVMSIHRHFSQHPFTGLRDLVPAYCSITFCYDPLVIVPTSGATVFEQVRDHILHQIPLLEDEIPVAPIQVEVPVCYDPVLGNDLAEVAHLCGTSTDEVIRMHVSTSYHIFMIGFLPGFAYMGELDERLHLPRKAEPKRVTAGSVAIAGRQTGIYPLDSFGGWHVLGHTPLRLFDPALESPCTLSIGLEVRFIPIGPDRYAELSHKQRNQ